MPVTGGFQKDTFLMCPWRTVYRTVDGQSKLAFGGVSAPGGAVSLSEKGAEGARGVRLRALRTGLGVGATDNAVFSDPVMT